MAKDTFSQELRVLLCPQCGGSIDAKPEGGMVTCSYCKVKMMLASRADIVQALPVSAPAPGGPSRRLEMLRAQDGQPLMPPPELRYLMRAGELSPDQVDQAMQEWQKARGELIATAAAAAAERMYFLTMFLQQHYKKHNDLARVRALLETALELLVDPRHVQDVRCMMARLAAGNNEMDAAKQWLAQCETEPSDLHMDSAFRFTKSTLATREGDWNEVIRQLGASLIDPPIADQYDGICAVLRANAFEKTGQLDKAKTLLRQFAAQDDEKTRLVLAVIERYKQENIALCEQSAADLIAAQARAGKGVLPRIVRVVRIIASLAGALLVALRWIPLSFIPQTEDFFHQTMVVGFILLSLACAPLVSMLVFRIMFGNPADRAKLQQTGLTGKAELMAVTPTGWKINDVPQYKMELRIILPGREPYAASLKVIIKPEQKDNFQPGVTLGVKVDPEKPKKFILEM